MANFTEVLFCADDLPLDRIVGAIRETEDQIGPLIAISACEDFPPKRYTCFTHEQTSAPATPIDLQTMTDDSPPNPPGKTLVCIGNCYVAGALVAVAAFR